MKAQFRKVILAMLSLLSLNAAAVTRYVDLNSPSPTPPYTNWPTAATNIQDAIDVADPGDQILVTNGVYETGGRVVFGAMTNRVAITKAVTVQSVNGPAVTVIQGGSTNGDSAVRCVYVTDDAVLAGFTLSNGHTRTTGDSIKEQRGGGAWCEAGGILTNCLIINNSADSSGGGVYGGSLYDCVLATNNCASDGGGADQSTLYDCTLIGNLGGGVYHGTLYRCDLIANSGNYARSGAGARSSTLYDCLIASNTAVGGMTGGLNSHGGGAAFSTLSNCWVIGNSAFYGGGVDRSTLYRCIVTTNSAGDGGGAYQSTLYSCILSNNRAGNGWGGGAHSSVLSNCVISKNWAANEGGGVYESTNYNCVIRSNSTFYSSAGGASQSKLYNCLMVGNTGGASGINSALYNCTVTFNSNSIVGGGGVNGGKVYNSIVYSNSAPSYPNWTDGTLFTNSCTTPPPSGFGNIANPPGFVNAATGNFRLRTNSPCINAGKSSFITNVITVDLDGRPRLVGTNVDMGAYEYQGPGMGEFIGWLGQYGLPTDGSADFTDNDDDGYNNWQEWRADTIPTNALSALRMVTATTAVTGLDVTWQSVVTRSYFLERATNFGFLSPFQTIATNIPGASGTKTFTDTSATNGGPFFYRVGVQ